MFIYNQVKKEYRIKPNDNSILPNIPPYKTSIEGIIKIELESNPREKFETLMNANLEMKTSVLDITGGKCELTSMDDELPICIYIATQINMRNVVAEVAIIEDYFVFSKDCIDKESKVLTNLKVREEYLFIFLFILTILT